MSQKYKVKQGDCLSSIARQYGFRSWEKLYNHPDNAVLKEKRPNPNVIEPGDAVFIPLLETKIQPAETDKKHRFKATREPARIRIRVIDEQWGLLTGKPFKLYIGADVFEGTLNRNGEVDISIDGKVDNIELEVHVGNKGDTCSWVLMAGGLDPIETTRGLQMRLANLSIDPGPIDGIVGPLTKGAIKRFQRVHDLIIDGILGPQTSGKLKEVCGV